MQQTHIANAKKEAINFFSCFAAGTIISEVNEIYDAYRFSNLHHWNREELTENDQVINAVSLFAASLTELYFESATVVISSPKETIVHGERYGATIDSMNTDKFLMIAEKLFSKFTARQINETLWESYFEAMCIEGENMLKRNKLSSIGFTLRMITQLITELDFIVNRMPTANAVLN